MTPTSSVDAVGQEQKGDEDEGNRNDKMPHLVLVAKAHGSRISLKVTSMDTTTGWMLCVCCFYDGKLAGRSGPGSSCVSEVYIVELEI